jgi:hypothetical protein
VSHPRFSSQLFHGQPVSPSGGGSQRPGNVNRYFCSWVGYLPDLSVSMFRACSMEAARVLRRLGVAIATAAKMVTKRADFMLMNM